MFYCIKISYKKNTVLGFFFKFLQETDHGDQNVPILTTF